MHKKIVSTCSPNNNMCWSLYSVYRQEIPWRVIFSNSVGLEDWNWKLIVLNGVVPLTYFAEYSLLSYV